MELLEKVELVCEKCGVSYEEAREALEANNNDVLDAIVAIERRGRIVKAAEGIAEAAQELVDEMSEDVAETVESAEPEVIEVASEWAEVEPIEVPAAESVVETVEDEPAQAEPSFAEAADHAAEPQPTPQYQAFDEDPGRAQRRAARRSKIRSAWRSFWVQCANVIRSGLRMTFVAERNDEVMFSLPVLFLVIGMLAWGATLWLLVAGLFFGFRYHVEGASPMTVDVNQVMDRAADLADDIKRDVA